MKLSPGLKSGISTAKVKVKDLEEGDVERRIRIWRRRDVRIVVRFPLLLRLLARTDADADADVNDGVAADKEDDSSVLYFILRKINRNSIS